MNACVILATFMLCITETVYAQSPGRALSDVEIREIVECIRKQSDSYMYELNSLPGEAVIGDTVHYYTNRNGTSDRDYDDFLELKKCYNATNAFKSLGLRTGVASSTSKPVSQLLTESDRYLYFRASVEDDHEHDSLSASQDSQMSPAIDATQWGRANMNMRFYIRSTSCAKGASSRNCYNNFDMGECITQAGSTSFSVGFDNFAGHEHDLYVWLHNNCRSQTVSKDDNSVHVGEYFVFWKGNGKCRNDLSLGSFWVMPNNNQPRPNLVSRRQGLPGTTCVSG